MECHGCRSSSARVRAALWCHQRYWIYSRAEGAIRVLGSILFAAPAKKLADRDAWIGWTDLERKRFRYRLLGNSRFLILPGVQVPHLASHVLAIAVRRLRSDWSKRYGYAPVLLETFVTPPNKGTCYRAANWCFIGETASTDRYISKEESKRYNKDDFHLPFGSELAGRALRANADGR